MIDRSTFTVTTSAGSLAGWFVGDGPRVLLLHGGPGLGYDYMLPLVAELEAIGWYGIAGRAAVYSFCKRSAYERCLDSRC